MTPQEISREAYLARINKVMTYVDANLSENLNLELLADIAHFSPFHFHRIFSVIVGETPAAFIQRIRLEKAAQQLRDYPQKTIGDIAHFCGFSSVALFSRTFRKHFGLSASQFRLSSPSLLVKDGIYYSKNGQALGKISQLKMHDYSDLCNVNYKQQLIIMETKIIAKEMPEMQVIYCRHTGAYNQIGEAYGKLMRFAGPRGLMSTPNMKTLTVYHDDPSVTEIEKVRQSACLIVNQDVKVEGEIGKMTVPGGKYAVGYFEINESEFEQAWNTMCLWLTESGYIPGEGNPFELYHNNHMEHPERKFQLDICIPIKTL